MVSWDHSRNVYFYLHKAGMYSNRYKPDMYSSGDDAPEKDRNIAASRFEYRARPSLEWVQNGLYPSPETYEIYKKITPNSIIDLNQRGTNIDNRLNSNTIPQIALVEIPFDFQQIKSLSFQLAQQIRQNQDEIFPRLFEAGYTAVDATLIENHDLTKSSYIVCLQGFDEKDPLCLVNAIQNS